ncbi:uncharacterized protein N7518_004575 [Penicillium psychrosexuale]|uniref:uncharacterized protein n=1 Tax=Penicillium psychrosexuale TaxID=1002107 RepID=UPI0025451893|nr:uncharacterized protein N7518_004575 [Penicillium psychrosexuale]KAJ5796035.1 hypothetical protein N7518_004575 [Penicillium psychrosexuale]
MSKTNLHLQPQEEEPGLFNAAPSLNPPPTPATKDYKLNHLALRIQDPTRSLNFYINLLGMRIIFTMNAGPFTIYYLGHPPPSAMTEDDITAWANHERNPRSDEDLFHMHGTENVDGGADGAGAISTGNVPPHLGFAHLGFTVPDVSAAVRRLRDGGVRILKDVGVSSREAVPLSEWEEERGIARGEIHANYAWFFEKFAMVADPDGYTVELIPQNV